MRLSLLFLILLLLANAARAGEILNAYGLKAGVIAGFANHTGEYPIFKKSTLGFSPSFSIFKNFPLKSNLILQPSFEWIQQTTVTEIFGSSLGGDVVSPPYRRTKSSCISLPILWQ